MSGTPYKNLRMFTKLCGNIALTNVVLVTTMWASVTQEVGARRVKELRDKFWKPMLQNGSAAFEFRDTAESAWNIVDSVISKTRIEALLLQEEMVDLRRRLSETEAGITLYNALQKLLASQKETIRRLREEAEAQHNEKLVRELNAQHKEIQENLRVTFDQIQQMKISFFRRMYLILFGGSAKAVSGHSDL
jgi:Fe2+ transport system protein B